MKKPKTQPGGSLKPVGSESCALGNACPYLAELIEAREALRECIKAINTEERREGIRLELRYARMMAVQALPIPND